MKFDIILILPKVACLDFMPSRLNLTSSFNDLYWNQIAMEWYAVVAIIRWLVSYWLLEILLEVEQVVVIAIERLDNQASIQMVFDECFIINSSPSNAMADSFEVGVWNQKGFVISIYLSNQKGWYVLRDTSKNYIIIDVDRWRLLKAPDAKF